MVAYAVASQEASGDSILASRVAEARDALGLSQEELGALLNPPLFQSQISAIENASRGTGPATLREFARVLRRPVSWLLGDPFGDFVKDVPPEWASLPPEAQREVLDFASFLAARATNDQRAERVSGSGGSDGPGATGGGVQGGRREGNRRARRRGQDSGSL